LSEMRRQDEAQIARAETREHREVPAPPGRAHRATTPWPQHEPRRTGRFASCAAIPRRRPKCSTLSLPACHDAAGLVLCQVALFMRCAAIHSGRNTVYRAFSSAPFFLPTRADRPRMGTFQSGFRARRPVSFPFYGGGCQETPPPIARRCPCSCIRRPPPFVSQMVVTGSEVRSGCTSAGRARAVRRCVDDDRPSTGLGSRIVLAT